MNRCVFIPSSVENVFSHSGHGTVRWPFFEESLCTSFEPVLPRPIFLEAVAGPRANPDFIFVKGLTYFDRSTDPPVTRRTRPMTASNHLKTSLPALRLSVRGWTGTTG